MTTRATTRLPGPAGGLLLGVGLGGFVDGIVLHQLLQWHHLVSHVDGLAPDTVPALQVNTFADGAFHVATWLCVVAGSSLAIADWRAGRLAPAWRFHVGLVLAGWGGFNLIEGLVNHQLLGIHHVRDDLGAPWQWDVGFLLLGAVLVACGWALYRAGRAAMGERPAAP